MAGHNVALPDPRSIFPYLGLFTIVILRPEDVVRHHLLTPHYPTLSILQYNHFESASNGTSPVDQNVARIFDVLAIAADPHPISFGIIPFSDDSPEYTQQRYWRLPVKVEVVLAALANQVGMGVYEAEELCRIQYIIGNLMQRRSTADVTRVSGSGGPSGGGSGPSCNGLRGGPSDSM
jgi:hypothetical protein